MHINNNKQQTKKPHFTASDELIYQYRTLVFVCSVVSSLGLDTQPVCM